MPAGRPTEADTERIAQIALRLFEHRGFDAVTMDDVATAASVSRRTLFRHFPSKSDLVWSGVAAAIGMFKSHAAPLEGERLALATLVHDVFMPVLTLLDDPEMAQLARRRLRLIAKTPALAHHPVMQEVESLVASIISSSALPKHTTAPLVARTLVTATFSALLWWAEHGDGQRAREVALGALQAIAIAVDRR